jgi:hypothetical protein
VRTRARGWVKVGVLVAVLPGCGAAPVQPAAVAPAPEPVVAAVGERPAEAADAPSSVSKSIVVQAPPPPPPPSAPMGGAPAPAVVAVPATPPVRGGGSAAQRELALALQQLQASAGDCATACRALGSMERATAHLCALATSASESQDTCQDARSKVLSGRDRVEASCGECPGGPSLDRNAPIPSTR